MSEDKGHKPTSRRLRQARREGRVLKSTLATQVFVFIVVFTVCIIYIRINWVSTQLLLNYCLNFGFEQPLYCLEAFARSFYFLTLVCVGSGCVAALVVEWLQCGLQFETTLVVPKLSKLNPLAGLGRITHSITEGWQSVMKVCLMTLIGLWLLHDTFVQVQGSLPAIDRISAGNSANATGSILQGLMLKILTIGSFGLVVCGFFDYALQRRKYFRDLSMSIDEVKREYREDEGDPMMKAMRRSMHEALVRQEMISRVRKAKVIVVARNDTKNW